MITRCPACQTAFRVNDAQLAARDGQVRCGACANIFDASAFLVDDAAANATASGNRPSSVVSTVAAIPEADYEPFVPDIPSAAGTATVAEGVPDDASAPTEAATTQFAPELALQPSSAADTSPGESSFEFGPGARTPGRRGPWIAASVLLLLLLLAQALFYFRGDVAVLVPEAKPLLKDACAMLGCVIPLPRRSELMSIEASDLQADSTNPNIVVLTATLRNRAAFAQAHPSLELTLTDSQDLPLARRVLLASDYLDGAGNNDNGFAAGAERPVKLTLQLADIKATGYRLYLFYP